MTYQLPPLNDQCHFGPRPNRVCVIKDMRVHSQMSRLPPTYIFMDLLGKSRIDSNGVANFLSPLLDHRDDIVKRVGVKTRPVESAQEFICNVFVRASRDGRRRVHVHFASRAACTSHRDGIGRICGRRSSEFVRVDPRATMTSKSSFATEVSTVGFSACRGHRMRLDEIRDRRQCMCSSEARAIDARQIFGRYDYIDYAAAKMIV